MTEKKNQSQISENDLLTLRKFADHQYETDNYSETLAKVPPLVQRGAIYLIIVALIVTSLILYVGRVGKIVSVPCRVSYQQPDYQVKSFAEGIVIDVLVKENQILKKGEPLVILELIDHSENVIHKNEEKLKQYEQQKQNVTSAKNENNENATVNYDITLQYINDVIGQLRSDKPYFTVQMPMDGRIVSINSIETGKTVLPEMSIINIQPENSPLIVEAKVPNHEIRLVKIGNPVKVKLDAFPFQQFGVLEAEVENIFPPKTNESSFTLLLKLNESSYTLGDQKYSIYAGLQGVADIIAGDQPLYTIIFQK